MSRIDKLLEFIKEQPEDAFLQHALALEYIKIGEETKALEIFENILQKNEEYYGTYYHLAKLYERLQQNDKAILTYEKGILICKKLKENHALGELQSAYEELTF